MYMKRPVICTGNDLWYVGETTCDMYMKHAAMCDGLIQEVAYPCLLCRRPGWASPCRGFAEAYFTCKTNVRMLCGCSR